MKTRKVGELTVSEAEVYSPNLSGIGHNERIVGEALRDVRGDEEFRSLEDALNQYKVYGHRDFTR